MRRLIPFLIVAAALVSAAWGCSSKKAGEADVIEIAVIPKQLTNPVFQYARIGAEAKAKEIGGVRIEWAGPAADSPDRQAQIIRSLVARGIDGIAISCSNPDVLKDPINEAVAAGVPVVTWDSDSPDSKRMAYYGINDYATGVTLGEEFYKHLAAKGPNRAGKPFKVAILSGVQGAYNLDQRLKGVRKGLEPHVSSLEIINNGSPYWCQDDVKKSVDIIRQVANLHPDLDGWVMIGGWPLNSDEGLSALDPAKCVVASYDTLPPNLKWLENGRATILIGQKYFGWGARPVEMIVNFKKTGAKPPKPIVYSGVDIVTKKNLPEYRKKWADWEAGRSYE